MSLRSLLFASIAFLATTAQLAAAQPFRLFEIFVERVVRDNSGTPIFDIGRLNALGQFTHILYAQIPLPEQVPDEALNLNLLPFSAFPAYDALGDEALANFSLQHADILNLPPDGFFTFSGQSYFVVTPAADARLDVGSVVNISTRGAIAANGEPLIAGFVVEDHPRRVLIRGVGPSLAGYSVDAPLADPDLTVFRQGQDAGIASNDDWEQQTGAADVEAAAASIGAFPLEHGSKDAALVVELAPGAYTAHVGTADGTGGTALIEIYFLP